MTTSHDAPNPARPPDNSVEKLNAARIEATRVRANLYQHLEAGRLTFHDVVELAEHNRYVAQTRLRVILSHLPKWNDPKALRTMERLSISPSRRMSGLASSPRQLEAILGAIYPKSTRVWAQRPWDGWPYRQEPTP